MKNMFAILFLFLQGCTTTASAGDQSQTDEWFCYRPCISELVGVIHAETRYGPPNFGETPDEDIKYTIYLLGLDEPIKIKNASNENEDVVTGIEDVQIELYPIPENMQDFVSKRVVVRGKLQKAILSTHFEPIVITAESVNLQ